MHSPAPNCAEARDVLYHLHSQTNAQAHAEKGPLIMERGEGIHVFDSSGKRYVEAMAGLWCTSLGFSQARLKSAAARAYDKFGFYHTFNHKTPAETIALAEKLVALSPIPEAQAYFATSGSEATETMVKLAWVYHAARGKPGKRKIIARDRGFHGSTIVAASMCGLPRMHREFGLPLPGFLHTLCPDPYRGMQAGEDAAGFVTRLASVLEDMILREEPDTVAAFIAEPINAGGGVIVPPADYFPAIEAVLRKHDILVLADEVVCGFGRTGNWWGSQTVGMTPDVMAMAKGISSSYFPISAVLLGRPVQDALAEMNKDGEIFGHGFTNSGHPVGVAVALETIRIYEEMDVVPHVRAMGARLRDGLETIAAASRIAGEVRGAGLMFGVELVAEPGSRTPFDPALKVGARFDGEALQNGLVIRPIGDIIAICPSLIIDEAGVDEILDLFGRTLRSVEAGLDMARAAAE
jgi:4-aminobutyrate--pyruvate transaminase